ncbi:MAG TPA: glycosyl hydrolase family 39 [Terriglobia bacterium]|nr:glycosyl hydrolase family 39 [Terriglobia bacterium]
MRVHKTNAFALSIFVTALISSGRPTLGADSAGKVEVKWDQVERVSRTTPTLQVVVNPPLRRGSAIHDPVFRALRDLGCDYVRYVPWLPYPKLAVAELEPPKDDKTSWDFSLIDPMTEDFLAATEGHSVILNFSTIPQWMFKTEKPVAYPVDPDQVFWNYTQGTELRDSSLKELAGYYARLVSWYTQGGFTDEAGRRHESGHHYQIPYWEVWNEVDFEHSMTPEQYTARYDAVVAAMHQVAPQMKFVGLALAAPSQAPGFFEYFLNPQHHQPGIPLDMISYHFYATPGPDQSPEVQQFTFFEQADHFLDVVRYIDAIRQRLSPGTHTTIDEIGSIAADDGGQDQPGHVTQPIPNSYWNLSGAMYAYVFAQLARQGIDVAGESQLVGYPTQFPSVSMVDWNTGQPNARTWVLKLLHDNFAPGDKLVNTRITAPNVFAQAFVTRDGRREILLVNQRDRALGISLPGVTGARVDYVDQTTAFQPPASAPLPSDVLTLRGLGVAVVTLPK